MGRSRKRRVGASRHPGVALLRPTKSRHFFRLRWRDAEGVEHQRSTGLKSEMMARQKAVELSQRLSMSDGDAGGVTWVVFCKRYEEEHLSQLAPDTAEAWRTASGWYTNLMHPQFLDDVTTSNLSRYVARLTQALSQKLGRARQTTIAAYLRPLNAAFGWAQEVGMLADRPKARIPKRSKGIKPRGRPIRPAEFERMLKAVPQIRPRDPGIWQRYLWGLWLSGLRRGESLILSWDEDADFVIDLAGRFPRFRIWAEGEKGHQDRLLPMTPDFAQWILQTPEDDRCGLVFAVETLSGGGTLRPRTVGRIVTDIGEAAGVVVNKSTGKYASCHDLRRSFGTRWAPRVKPATLRVLMRHKSTETTMQYYIDLDADDLAADLWRFAGEDVSVAQGDTLGDSTELPPSLAEFE